jgi:multiple sugar transport system substrate-binding protein
VPKALGDVVAGKSDPAEAAERARRDVEAIKDGVN